MMENDFNPNNIVISGIAGRFPNSRNLSEFAHNLYNKIDMVDEAETRWKHFLPEVPRRTGKIPDLEKFDASFFSLNKNANFMVSLLSNVDTQPTICDILKGSTKSNFA